MQFINRMAGLCGALAPVAVLTSVAMADLDAQNVAIDSSAAQIAAALIERHDALVVAGWAGLAALMLLAVFTARLAGVLSEGTSPPSWLGNLTLLGGGIVLMVLVVDTGMIFAAQEAAEFRADPEAVKAIYAWSWNSASVYAPGFGAMVLAATLVARVDPRFPRWFVWYGAASIVAILAIALMAGAPGLATMPALLWVIVCGVLLAVRTNLSIGAAGSGP